MYRRPDSVLAVAVILILIGAVSFFGSLLILVDTDHIPAWMDTKRLDALNVIKIAALIDSVIMVVCGLNLMHGANWARWLFTFDAIASSALSAVLLSDNLKICVTTFAFRVACLVFLFLPEATRYFRSGTRR